LQRCTVRVLQMIFSNVLTLINFGSIAIAAAVNATIRAPLASRTPSLESDFSDPSLIQVNETWYSFASERNGVRVQIASSQNFDQWSILNGVDALPKLPPWVKQDQPDVWAPDVVQIVRTTFIPKGRNRIRKCRLTLQIEL
jgi:beta-xylosidase